MQIKNENENKCKVILRFAGLGGETGNVCNTPFS